MRGRDGDKGPAFLGLGSLLGSARGGPCAGAGGGVGDWLFIPERDNP